jgi:hypothetical protein
MTIIIATSAIEQQTCATLRYMEFLFDCSPNLHIELVS